jgi:hypothetical protein
VAVKEQVGYKSCEGAVKSKKQVLGKRSGGQRFHLKSVVSFHYFWLCSTEQFGTSLVSSFLLTYNMAIPHLPCGVINKMTQ